MRMSCFGMEGSGDAAGDGVEFDADEAAAGRALAHEVADAAAGFQDGGVVGNAQPGDGLVHGRDDGRRGVEGVEGRALGTVVFFRREQRLQLVAKRLPAGVLVSAGDRIGEDRKGDGTETTEASEQLLFVRYRRALFLLDGLQRADRGDDVAGLRFLAAGDRERL